MSGEITVTLDRRGDAPRFHLRSKDGAVPRVMMVVFVEIDSGEPVWVLAPAAFVPLPFTVVPDLTEEDLRELSEAGDIDPIEDLPPSDPRHQNALRERDAAVERSWIPLDAVTYGTVPQAFRQALPADGVAPTLVVGRAYGIQILGQEMSTGHLLFDAG
jgi:hypothetical protein